MMKRKTGNATNVSPPDKASDENTPAHNIQQDITPLPATDIPVKQKRDKAIEVERLYTLIRPLAYQQGKVTHIRIPLEDGNTRPYRLSTVKRYGEQARSWVRNAYRELHGITPLISTFNDACLQVQSAMLAIPFTEDQQDATGASNDVEDKPKSYFDECIEKIAARSNWMKRASDIRASYARVSATDIEIRGLWRLDGRKTVRLTDAYVEVLTIGRPHSANKNARNRTLTLRFTDVQGLAKEITVTDEQVLNNELANKLSGYASYPEIDINKRYFSEALQMLAREVETTIQDETETLGWQTLPDNSLIWAMSNGCETLNGFIARKYAPFLPPEIPVLRHGYYGQAIVSETQPVEPDVNYWQLLLEKYAPHADTDAWFFALIGLSASVMLPDGLAPDGMGIENGTLRISPDLIGIPGRGKSRSLNAILALFGTRFQWDTAPLLTTVGAGKGDTGIGRNGLLSAMRYHLIVDFDHKAAPDNVAFPRQHETRSNTITNYVDGASGGTKGKRLGGISGRDVPAGCVVRTCNSDHAPISISEDNEMIERRACSFIWPADVTGNDTISRLLDKYRLQGYVTGQAYRKWIMQNVASERETFTALLASIFEIAHTIASDSSYTWAYDMHRNHAELTVTGVLIFQQFLSDTQHNPYLYTWLDARLQGFMKNRSQRSCYIQELATMREEVTGIDTFVVNTLRYLLSSGLLYIRSQKDALLDPCDIDGCSFGMKDIGYRSIVRDSTELWEAGRQCIGYLVHKGQSIAVETTLFMEVLRREAVKKNITIDSGKHTLATLTEKGLIIPERDKDGNVTRYEQQVKKAGVKNRFAVIPVFMLFGDGTVVPDEIAETDAMSEQVAGESNNVIQFPTGYASGYTGNATSPAIRSQETRSQVNGTPVVTSAPDDFTIALEDIQEEYD